MRHLSDGALRRLYDEPYALGEEARAHYRDCAECQARFTSVADDARHALTLMAVPGATVDPATALARVKAGTGSGRSRRTVARLPMLRGGWRRPTLGMAAVAALAVALVGSMAFTPLASTIVNIFQPSQVTPVTINQGDLTGLDALSGWGDVRWTKQPELQEAESAAEAARISGLPVIRVDAARLPASLAKAPVSYAAVGEARGSVTFNSKAPSSLRGSTLTVVVGPAETAVYGDLGKLATSAKNASGAPGSASGDGAAGSQTAGQGTDAARQAIGSAGPILAVAEMKAPQVSSTGASVADIKKALLAQPGLSPAVRAAISSIDDPKGNLPIPIPAGQVNAHDVKVQGVAGTAVGDNTGLGSAVIWIKNGRVHGVAGTLTEDQVLAVAKSLT